ncbi:HNH endonuclease [Aerococcus urinaeequi]|uniref:HNH endonuclease n=1 Tax=Aerococcus urinaeequi TaxID=51665 RepID=UPI003D6A53E0
MVKNIVNIYNKKFTIVDALNNITLADSFLRNKTGTGNGEAKLYVGNKSPNLLTFFDNFIGKKKAFFLKRDFISMLEDLKIEFKTPSSTYYSKIRNNIVDVTDELPDKWDNLYHNVIPKLPDVLPFEFYRSNVNPPRIYINTHLTEYRDLLRDIGIPNISYVSILKLEDDNNELHYYFKPFVSYSNGIVGYTQDLTVQEEIEIEKIEESSKSNNKKTSLINARVGQGKYREELLNDMPYCPFTNINDERLLIASHIKPWAKSNDKEKIDPNNGFIFSPTYDALFDKGLITFLDDGTLIVSEFVTPMNQKRLDIETGKNIHIDRFINDERKSYLKYHRKYIYNGVTQFNN